MLTLTKIKIKSNNLNKDSLVPDFKGGGSVPSFKYKNGFEPSMLKGFNEGMVEGVLPYTLQNGFDREFSIQEFDAIVLENDYLKAIFLVGLGGRLWSLYDKKNNKDLIYENDALVFANLALRKAWFAGGVEWNVGMRGHSVFTCDKLFATFEKTVDGNDVLKMYEYETIRGLVFVMRFTLKEDKLLCKFEIENVSDKDTYCYWWSNIAVELKNSSRVIVPTNKTYLAYYSNGYHILTYENVPEIDGVDTSYSNKTNVTADYFYDIPSENKKWLYSVDDSGYGLLQYSSRNTLGKKQFVWGHTQGGEHWNEWVTDGRPYLEVQSGILETQFQHFILKKGETITFYEVYTSYSLQNNAFDSEYSNLVNELDGVVDEALLDDKYFNCVGLEKPVYYGSARGALNEAFSGKRLSQKCNFYKESISNLNKYYVDLLNGETNNDYQIFYVNDVNIYNKITQKPMKNNADYYFGGVTGIALKDYENAANMLEKVGKGEYYALSKITLAIYYAKVKGDALKGYDYAVEAIKNSCDKDVLLAYADVAVLAKKYKECIATIMQNGLDKKCGRFKLYLLTCYEKLDMLDSALEILNGDFLVPDIREGEYSIYSVYVDIYKKVIEKQTGKTNLTNKDVDELYPIKKDLDFRLD